MSSTDIGDSFDYDIADNRVRLAIEDLPPRFLVGTYLEVNEMRYESAEIRRLYTSARYPLTRRGVDSPV